MSRAQKYRHVDYVQFENRQLVERFLDYWRRTGDQRMGYLYGRYEPHKDMPLGIRAVVSAIYEPLQVWPARITCYVLAGSALFCLPLLPCYAPHLFHAMPSTHTCYITYLSASMSPT